MSIVEKARNYISFMEAGPPVYCRELMVCRALIKAVEALEWYANEAAKWGGPEAGGTQFDQDNGARAAKVLARIGVTAAPSAPSAASTAPSS